MYSMRAPLKIDKLNDEFGQYDLDLTCRSCGHVRRAVPKTLAVICGWEARLDDVMKRMRCSKCGKRECVARVIELQKPRKLRDARS
jgi:DNA-directed RNA polymerase subunit RPC12/RpoP